MLSLCDDRTRVIVQAHRARAVSAGADLVPFILARRRRAGVGHRLPQRAGARPRRRLHMSQAVLTKATSTDATGHRAPLTDGAGEASTTKVSRRDIAGVLVAMTIAERIRAYEKETFTRQELNAAASREPERMPTLNGEFEWIAWNLADLD
jgi:hypothetical protein